MSELTGLRIGRQVGGGGTATVHHARTALGDEVAVKVFPSTADAAQVRREAEMAERFAHAGVVRVHGLLAAGPSAVLVMDWAPRGSLAELIAARGRLSVGETITVAGALAAVLATARGKDLVHGDLTVANVVLSVDGRPLLTDFGSARLVGDVSTPVSVTPTDLAPEVARGGLPDQAADLFGLGSVLLTCLTGRPAWSAVDVRDVVVQSTVGQWPDPGTGPLADLVRDLLAENPSDRPDPVTVLARLRRLDSPQPLQFPPAATAGRHSATDEDEAWPDPRGVVTQLRRTAPEPEPAPKPSRRRAILVVAAAAVVVLGLLAAVVLVRRGPAVADELPPPTTSLSTTNPPPTVGPLSMARATTALLSTVPQPTLPIRPVRSSAGPPVPPSAVAPSSVAPAPDPAVVTGDHATADWLAVVTELDSRRAHALTTRDAAFLDLVYVTPSVLAEADSRTITELVATDRRLADAAHLITEVRWERTEPDGAVRLLVTDELPTYPILSADGTKVGTTAARGASAQVMVLEPTPEGFRIRSVTPA